MNNLELASTLESLASALRAQTVDVTTAELTTHVRRIPPRFDGESIPSGNFELRVRLVDREAASHFEAAKQIWEANNPGIAHQYDQYGGYPCFIVDELEMSGGFPSPRMAGRTPDFVRDPYTTGAALVLRRGNQLDSITAAEAERFRSAFYSVFASISPVAFNNLLETIRPLVSTEPTDTYSVIG